MSVNSKMTAIANAIRDKTGGTASLSLDDMAVQIANISTGMELNFDVVGGTSQPSNPKENMIWVNSSTAVTDWVFSATQPTAASGRVWISIGTESRFEFNALTENCIQVYPLSAKQYISGTWVSKEVKSYQNGKWVDWWDGTLYGSGKEDTAMSGSLYFCIGVSSTSGYTKGTGTKNTSSILLQAAKGKYICYRTENAIDLTNFSKVVINVTSITSNGESYVATIGVSQSGSDTEIAIGVNKVASLAITTTGEHELDISTLSDPYYLYVAANAWSDAKSTAKIEFNMWGVRQ